MSTVNNYNEKIIAEFRANAGRVGGPFDGAPLLLLHTTGAKSGNDRVNPMMYLPDDGRALVFASAAGADQHPAWYFNLLANPQVVVEIGTETYHAIAEPVPDPERGELYAEQARRYPGFADYQRKTSRVIPVVALTPTR
jgi:deazaflavin-dependent oxidoreductase (nitroreductase family)